MFCRNRMACSTLIRLMTTSYLGSLTDVVMLQETWHLSNSYQHLSSVHKDYMYVEQSGVDSQTEILSGRPKGGLAIFCKSSLAGYVTKVHSDSRRVCAIRLHTNDTDVVIINAYMPCDNRRANVVNPEYQDVIDFIIGADWNTDTERMNAQTRCFNEFVERNGLLLCWNHLNARKDYTYVNHELGHNSRVDHFLISTSLYDLIDKCSVD